MNAETLVETHNRQGEKLPPGTKVNLPVEILESYVERGVVKELKTQARTKELKVKEVETKGTDGAIPGTD